MAILLTILQIRFRQFYRMLKDIGLVLLALLVPILSVWVLGVLEHAQKSTGGTVAFVALLMVLSVHYGRKDGLFLKQLDFPRWKIYALEYSVLLLPFSCLFFVVLHNWVDPVLMQLGALLIGLLPQRQLLKSGKGMGLKLHWFPLEAFEWRCGLRQYWWFVGLVYLSGLLLSTFVASIILVIIVLAYMGATAYNDLEGKAILESTYFRSSFLFRKIRIQAQTFHLFLLPLYLLFLFLHATYWYILLAAILVAQLLLLVCLLYKYANYIPGRSRVNHQVILVICSVALFTPLMPILFPGLLIYLIILWRKANKNLNYFYA